MPLFRKAIIKVSADDLSPEERQRLNAEAKACAETHGIQVCDVKYLVHRRGDERLVSLYRRPRFKQEPFSFLIAQIFNGGWIYEKMLEGEKPESSFQLHA